MEDAIWTLVNVLRDIRDMMKENKEREDVKKISLYKLPKREYGMYDL